MPAAASDATRNHHGIGIRSSASIHGGVVSSPHSHGWMRVTSPVRFGSRSAYSHEWYATSLGKSSARNAWPSAVGSDAATRRAAIATSGGWVMHDVSTSRGASACRFDCQTRWLPTSFTPSAKIMCGSIPFAHWPRNNARSSPAARARVVPRDADGDEARVPQPLVRVDRGRRARPRAAPVLLEHGLRAFDEVHGCDTAGG